MVWTEVNDLIERAQAGDTVAYGQLADGFYRLVYNEALKCLGNTHDAEDLTQMVFLHVRRKLGQLKSPQGFTRWLRTITRRKAYSFRMQRGRWGNNEPEVFEQTCGHGPEPVEVAERNDQLQRLFACIKRLNASDQAILEGFYFYEQSVHQLSLSFDVPEGTVKRRLHVARKRLLALMEPEVCVA